MPKKKKAKAVSKTARKIVIKSGKSVRRAGHSNAAERRLEKLERRRREKARITPGQWAQPAPAHLEGRIVVPHIKSKYQSYFEFAENTEKKEKKLEFKSTNDPNPPPGFTFIPVGDPDLTNMCKEISRERDAMIFIVSNSKEGVSKVSEHVYRIGYHFREAIVDSARARVGETIMVPIAAGEIDPIPESQEEITKQGDAAIRDLFPRIPNTDRTMILEQSFKKGAKFHGELTVGLQPDLPLSRRVQLAVLAHIRHTHTRYDQLLKETSWMNARKVVEPVCLDILVKWRGDEETGRDQMDEILREVVIITDSENEDDDDDDDDEDGSGSEEEASDEEGEVTSESSPDAISLPASRNQQYPPGHRSQSTVGGHLSGAKPRTQETISSRTRSKTDSANKETWSSNARRYRMHALEQAKKRQQDSHHTDGQFKNPRQPQSTMQSPIYEVSQHSYPGSQNRYRDPPQINIAPGRYSGNLITHSVPYHLQHQQSPVKSIPRNQGIVTQQAEQHIYQELSPNSNSFHVVKEQRPPQVVRGSPQRHGLQDMLMPSIETVPNDAMNAPSAINERRDHYSRFNHPEKSYSRLAVDDRGLSSPRRQVIVIDDDSPPAKRRRVREDDSSHFRPIPSNHTFYATSSPVDSHFMPPSSIQPRDFPTRHSALQSESSQGLLGDVRSSYHSSGRIPIYDAPDPGSLARPPEHFRRDAVDSSRREDPRLVPREIVGELHYHRLANPSDNGREHMRPYEHDRGPRYIKPDYRVNGTQRSQSPSCPVLNPISRSHEMGPRPVYTEQALSHDFSQSRIDGSVPCARNSFIVSDRPHYNYGQENLSRGCENHSNTFSTISARARSLERYAERPVREEYRQPDYQQSLPMYEERYAGQSRPIPMQRAPPAHVLPYGHPTHRREIAAID